MKRETKPGRTRRWRRALLLLLATGLVAVALMPVWMPWVLKPVAASMGVAFSRYERLSYDRVALEGVRYQAKGVTIEVSRLEAPMLWGWLQNRFGDRVADRSADVRVSGWRILVEDSPDASGGRERPDGSTAQALDKATRAAARLRAWLVSAEFEDGRFEWNASRWQVPKLAWRDGKLDASVIGPYGAARGELVVDVTSPPVITCALSVSEFGVQVTTRAAPVENGWRLDGQVDWLAQSVPFEARFKDTHWWPETASVTVTDLVVPTHMLSAAGLDSLVATVSVGWTNGRYRVEGRAELERPSNSEWMPSLGTATFAVEGDTASMTLLGLSVEAPPVELRLTEPCVWSWAEPWSLSPSAGRMTYRLQPSWNGQVETEWRTGPATRGWPEATFITRVDQMAGYGVVITNGFVRGRLTMPKINIEEGRALVQEAGTLTWTGAVDLARQAVTNFVIRYNGLLPKAYVPENVEARAVSLTGHAEGVWPGIIHRGTFTASNVIAQVFKADRLALSWNGQIGQALAWEGDLKSGQSEWTAAGSFEVDPNTNDRIGSLSRLAFKQGSRNELVLREPARVEWTRAGTETGRAWRVRGLDLVSEPGAPVARQMRLDGTLRWPAEGGIEASVVNLDHHLVREFFRTELPPVTLREVRVEGGWREGPLDLKMEWAAEHDLAGEAPIQLGGTIQADAQGLHVPHMSIAQGERTLAELSGQFPVTIHPSTPSALTRVNEERAMSMRGETIEAGPIWRALEHRFGVETTEPKATLVVTGSWPDTRASLELKANQIHYTSTNVAVSPPPVEHVHLRIEADRTGLELRQGAFEVLGRSGRLWARYDMEEERLEDWLRRLSQPSWDSLAAQARLTEFPLSTVSALAPELIAPFGLAELEVDLDPGLRFHGRLTVTNAATAPLGNLGTLREVGARIRFGNDSAELEEMKASWAGQPVRARGRVEWSDLAHPSYQLEVRGTNLSLVRGSGLFLRGDLDLSLAGSSNQPPVLSGEVTMRDSLLFQDLRSLVTLDLNRPEQRPPYFSIENEPLADWRLDLRVKGDQFMRVLTPVFKGELSTGLHLSGTLREPLAVGDITLGSGNILFPFGALDLTRGRILLTRDDPYHPQLDLQGAGYNYGYFVRLDISGTAGNPAMNIYSVPPLSPKEVLLMLTTGQIPDHEATGDTSSQVGRLGFFIGREFLSEYLGAGSSADRLSLRTGEYMTESGRLTYTLEYRLTERWSAFGEYNRFQDFNSGLKFKVFSK